MHMALQTGKIPRGVPILYRQKKTTCNKLEAIND